MRAKAILGVAVAAALPAIALADTGTSGNKQLRLTVGVRPALPSSKGIPRGVRLFYSQTLTTTDGSRPEQGTKRITIIMPKGFRINIRAFPLCTLSKLDAKGLKACPQGSEVGAGHAAADARPALPNLVPAKVRAFAGRDDIDAAGTPRKGVPSLIVVADASIFGTTVRGLFAADIKGRKLVVELTDENRGGPGSAYDVRSLSLSLRNMRGRDGAPLVQASRTCSGSWTSSQITTFADGSKVSAKDTVACAKG